eukprot:6020453-Alexandrium_andersonii.AAC.1
MKEHTHAPHLHITQFCSPRPKPRCFPPHASQPSEPRVAQSASMQVSTGPNKQQHAHFVSNTRQRQGPPVGQCVKRNKNTIGRNSTKPDRRGAPVSYTHLTLPTICSV